MYRVKNSFYFKSYVLLRIIQQSFTTWEHNCNSALNCSLWILIPLAKSVPNDSTHCHTRFSQCCVPSSVSFPHSSLAITGNPSLFTGYKSLRNLTLEILRYFSGLVSLFEQRTLRKYQLLMFMPCWYQLHGVLCTQCLTAHLKRSTLQTLEPTSGQMWSFCPLAVPCQQ